MNMRCLLALTCLLIASGTAHAQTHCLEGDTTRTCSDRLQGLVATEKTANTQTVETKKTEAVDATKATVAGVAAKNTGDGSTSTFNDFLPLLRGLIDTGGLSGKDGGKLGVEWSNPLGLEAEHQNKLTVGLVDSEVYEPLKVALRAASLESQISELDDKIDEGDDVTVGFSYARGSKRYGRDPRLHDELISDVFAQAAGQVDARVEAEVKRRRQLATDFVRDKLLDERANPRPKKLDFDKKFGEIGLTQPEMAEYMGLVETQIRAEHDSMRALANRLHKARFYDLLDLINNQPQLSFTAEYHSRDESVGPDEFKAAISYEKGFSNVSTYYGYERSRSCSPSERLLCLADYLSNESVIANLKESRRLTFKAEYSRLKRLTLSLPGTTPFTFSTEPVKRFSLSGGLGRYLGREVQGRTRARADVAVSYEDFSDDPSRQDRGLATATLTYPVAEGFFLSVGAVYATKPEFRGDVNKELSARAGIVYKVIQDR
jgi:hypothetical protein